jgi:hypothetical protein
LILSTVKGTVAERENIGIEKDDLICVFIVADKTRASVFRAMHEKGIFRKEEVKESD